jgi:hypothetical protein
MIELFLKAGNQRLQGGPSHLLAEGAPLDQINTRARDLRSQNQDDKPVPKGWKTTTTDVTMESQDNSVSNGSELDGVSLDSSNWSSNVPGNRDICRQDENPGRKAQMSLDEHTLPCFVEKMKVPAG